MSDAGDPFGSLPRSIRTRLDTFSARVDALPLAELQLMAVRPDAVRDGAIGRAAQLAARTSRTRAIAAIHDVALDYMARRYSESLQDARYPFLGRTDPLGTGAPDRTALARSFEDVLTAIALEDVLEPRDGDALVGPWADLLDGPSAR
jgi:hypothetical protein